MVTKLFYMLLIVEIILTVIAWRKGYKWNALWPIGIGIILGLFLGFFIAMVNPDYNETNLNILGSILDLGIIASLIVMIFRAKKEDKEGRS